MMKFAETGHSIPKAKAVASWVEENYDLGAVVDCVLWHRGINDTYFVNTVEGTYVLRLYRISWRTEIDVGYEMDILRYLSRNDVRVAVPVVKRDADPLGRFPAAEGQRIAVLFERAAGAVVQPEPAASRLLGAAAGSMHIAAKGFASRHERFKLDLGHLIDHPLARMQHFIAHRPDDAAFLTDFASQLRDIVEAAAGELDWGFCHGDVQFPNAHLDGTSVCLFDFDCCGEGWRSYDIAVFRWSLGNAADAEENWQSFLSGYTSITPLGDADLRMVPVFVALRSIWIRGLHTENADDFGRGWLNAVYWDRFFTTLREWSENISRTEAS